jgi:hypothetical protein
MFISSLLYQKIKLSRKNHCFKKNDDFIASTPTYAASTGPTEDWHATGLHILEGLQEATYVTCLTLQVQLTPSLTIYGPWLIPDLYHTPLVGDYR